MAYEAVWGTLAAYEAVKAYEDEFALFAYEAVKGTLAAYEAVAANDADVAINE